MRYIILTRDLVPIHFSKRELPQHDRIFFLCPLPKGFKEAIEIVGIKGIEKKIFDLITIINDKAKKREDPFFNIFEFYGDTKEQLNFDVTYALSKENLIIDGELGLRCIYAGWSDCGINIHSGDVHLNSNLSVSCVFEVDGFKDYFEPRTGFTCHNVDYYWQGLLTRELCIEYFNYLVQVLIENDFRKLPKG